MLIESPRPLELAILRGAAIKNLCVLRDYTAELLPKGDIFMPLQVNRYSRKPTWSGTGDLNRNRIVC